MKFEYFKTDETHKGMDVLERREKPRMCRRCSTKQAANGSSRCTNCSDEYKNAS